LVNSTWWQRKIVALLHDPPDKVLDIPTHKERAGALMQTALRGLPDVPTTGVPEAAWVDAANKSDTVASAADRLNFPEGLHAPSDCVLHPLSGQAMPLPTADPQRSSEVQADVIGDLSRRTNDPQKRFLLLWRCLEDELAKREPNVPWSLLPADTRIPDHPLLQHARVASAFANCLPNPATLLFTIGPVQGFIAAARKTRDLWMGSFLLSYLTWHAIKVIAERLGPDHVLFPSLLGQPLVDFWLAHEKGVPVEKSSTDQFDQLRLATLPNRFFAVVPAEQAEELAVQAKDAVRKEWHRLAEIVWQGICQQVPEFAKAKFIWERQLAQFPEIYWAIYRWDETPQKIAELFRQLTGSERFVRWLEATKGAYEHNQGSVYAACYELTERALGARKALRDFCDRSEPAGKCSLCGERQALSDLDAQVPRDWWNREKEFWKKIAQAREFRGDVDSDGSERLCAICTIKRFAAKFVFAKELGILTEFPSTDSIAAATFVKALFERERWVKVKEHVSELLASILANEQWGNVAFAKMDIPNLGREAGKLDNTARELIELDGEWLFAESYDPKRIQRAHGIVVSEEDTRQLREEVLRKLYEKIARPSDYYAVLFVDGDQMGKWLSGTHEDLPKFAEILHPQVREQLKGQSNWQTVLQTQRLMSPSLHAAISEALANFALNVVPFVVEKLHAGRLVYAGGDDVLALLPLADVLPAAHKLRALFSGEAKRFGNDILVEFGSKQWTGWLEWEGRKLLTMGNRATASIGIVVAHRLHPLRDVLRQGREAEEDAKELYERNAICVRWLKRSGEQVQMGAKFFYPNQCISDTLQVLMDFAELMRTKISRGFATDLMQESFALADLDEKAQEAELRRLLKRRSELSDDQIKDWAQKLARLAVALDTHADRNADPFDLTRPQRGIVELGKWLTFLRFLTGGGE
jgi:CRISPR-associated protein Cmr2